MSDIGSVGPAGSAPPPSAAPAPSVVPDPAWARLHELYREHRILDQRKYYEERATEYRRAHDQAVLLRNLLLFGAGLAAVVGQLMSGSARAGWSVLGAVLAALAGAITGYETLMGFNQLAKVFGDVAASLRVAEIEWDTTKPGGDLGAQVDHVEEILSRENGQWGQLLSGAQTPVAVPGGGGATASGSGKDGS